MSKFYDYQISAYLAPLHFIDVVKNSLRNIAGEHDRLIIAKGSAQPCYWAQNIWYDPQVIAIASINDAAQKLRAIQRNWWPYSFHLHRRTELIQGQLPHVSARPMLYPALLPAAPLGSFTLLDEHTLLAAANCSSPFPHGEPQFVEDKEMPPSRAYLKLWEIFTLTGRRPAAGQTCLEFGASPGSWTWVLAETGAEVHTFDRAALAPEIAALPNVHHSESNVFSIFPDAFDKVDWFFWDVICYPDKLYEHLQLWLASGKCANYVVTVKFQGAEHHQWIERFAAIPGSQLRHLYNNKHELTWTLLHND